MMIIRNWLGHLCEKLARVFEECERRLVVCRDCGRSRFYGRPCKGEGVDQ